MTTYVYETIPEKKGAAVRHYEFKQSMKDAAFSHHPETGEAIRRVISGGFGILKAAGAPAAPSAPRGGGCCGGGCGCHH